MFSNPSITAMPCFILAACAEADAEFTERGWTDG